jgi:hypothetical protein
VKTNEPMSAEERFDAKWALDPATGCHRWAAHKNRYGYGTFQRSYRVNVGAHRFAWEIANGPPPPGMHVCHRCDNRDCVNAAHMFLGTNDDNVADCRAKGRHARGMRLSVAVRANGRHWQNTPRGEAHYAAKVSDAQVAEMRAQYMFGAVSQRALARDHGLSQRQVGRIVRGERRTR